MGASLDSIYQEVLRLNEKLEALPGLIELSADQVNIVSLDELSETLGLIKAGEFRSGNLRVPGDSFSGIRIGYPGFYYPGTSTASSDLYNLAGVDVDTLQVGINASDGSFYAAAGQVIINEEGMVWDQTGAKVDDVILRRIRISNDNFPEDFSLNLYDALSTNVTAGDYFGAQLLFRAPSTVSDTTEVLFPRMAYTMAFRTSDTTADPDSAGRFVTINQFHHRQNLDMSASDRISLYAIMYDDSGGGGTLADFFFMQPELFGVYTVDSDYSWQFDMPLSGRTPATPSNGQAGLYFDTAAELRLIDTAAEAWYVTKSTSTGNAVVLIDDTTLAIASTGITFSSIPGTYKRLEIRGYLKSDTLAEVCAIQFNGDGAANYSHHRAGIDGNLGFVGGASTGTTFVTVGNIEGEGEDPNVATFSPVNIQIEGYADTVVWSGVLGRVYTMRNLANSDELMFNGGGFWFSVEPITSIDIFSAGTANLTAGSRLSLYGLN